MFYRRFNRLFSVALGTTIVAWMSACGSFVAKNQSDSKVDVGAQTAGFRVAFYNLENLFDTIDGPNDDAEFLPASENRWNTERYQNKPKEHGKGNR